ncbi:MAG: polysaccharide biosynthesis tyrosine autokinase [Actinomycetota bacterium]|nr:polysaccharide biosynthesis tyrosine autokinase [Actinomycetota bacterium]
MSRQFQEPRSVSTDGSVDLREFLQKVAHRKWLVLAVVVLVTGLAAGYSYSRPEVFSATSKVLVRPTLIQPGDTDPFDNISMATEAQLVASTDVARFAWETLGSSGRIVDLIGRVSVTTPEGTQILQITFTDRSADGARAGAQAFAQAYLEFKAEQATDEIAANTAKVQALIDDVGGDILTLDARIQDLTQDSPEWAIAKSDRRSAEARRSGLLDQLTVITTSSIDPGEVVQRAERPSAPISPKHQVDIALGVLLGLAAGVALASVREQLQDRIQSPTAFRKVLKAPTLGLIPESPMLRGDLPRLVTIDAPRSPAAEAYRTLRTNLLAACKGAKVRTILVTGARQGEGKTTTAVNLAVALAQVGRSVVLIGADLRYPRVHSVLGIGNERGLGQVLQGSVSLDDALVNSSIPDLRALPSGPVTGIDEPVELLQSDRMFEVIRSCRQADFVIVDGPPIEPVADSLVLADLVDGVLLVTDAQQGTKAGVSRTRLQLEQVGANILGGVLNRVDKSMTPDRYGEYEQRRGLLHRSPYDDTDRELASLRQETTWPPETSSRV